MFKISIKDIFYLILYSIPNTLLSFGILYIINNAISDQKGFLENYMWVVFGAVIIYTYLLNISFQKKLNKYSFSLLYKNEKVIFDKMLKTPLVALEKMGSQRFYTAVEDLRVFAFLPGTITHSINSILMIVLCVIYLFTISTSSALVIIALIILIAGLYFIIMNTMSKQVASLREHNEHYYKYVNDVMKGFKELKISNLRRKNLMDKFLGPNRDSAEDLDFNISYVFLSINLISQYGLYFVIGIILFLLPEFGFLKREDVISYVVILLFISGPINNLINLQNIYTRLMVANNRMKKFLSDFKSEDSNIPSQNLLNIPFQSLEFQNVEFEYDKDEKVEKANSFMLGPINLKIEKGETLFIIGGNGSGKSTFINILTGLYIPTAGRVILNGDTEIDLVDFQDLLTSIFTNNHVFSHNYDDYTLDNNPKYEELVKMMELDNVLEDFTEKGARRNFSKGQSKRMSMIFALLEQKPILILDEWAADQDPHFRKYFYEELIPKLRNSGKTIIAVTHDDAYFKQADRVVKFDYGQIVKNISIDEKALMTELIW